MQTQAAAIAAAIKEYGLTYLLEDYLSGSGKVSAAELSQHFPGVKPSALYKAMLASTHIELSEEGYLQQPDGTEVSLPPEALYWYDPGEDEANPSPNPTHARIRSARAPQRRGLQPGEWSYAKVPRAIFRDPDLPMAAKMAACALADALNVNGRTNAARVIKTSYDALAERMGSDRKTAQAGISRLIATGWITRTPGRGHGANRYRFTAKVRG